MKHPRKYLYRKLQESRKLEKDLREITLQLKKERKEKLSLQKKYAKLRNDKIPF